nr:uncharacterized protein LOC108071413 [Drosophila kikkawai]
MLQFLIYFQLILLGEAFIKFKRDYEFRFISGNYSEGASTYIDLSRIRLLGRERYVNGTVELKCDFGDDRFSVSAESFLDSNGDGNYKQLPMFVPRQPICKALESSWKYAEGSLKYGVNTNLPIQNHPCPIPKGIYYVKNASPQADDWPVIVPRGFLKAVGTFYNNSKIAFIVEVVIQIYDSF